MLSTLGCASPAIGSTRLLMSDSSKPDQRQEGRANVFLAASMDTNGNLQPVRIRNISPKGLLIEASPTPAVGTLVQLTRGELAACGEIAWVGAEFAGVRLKQTIDVDAWVRRVGHNGQQRVDRVIDALRRSEVVPTELQQAERSRDLESISQDLDAICARLATLPIPIEAGEELVRLDVLAGTLRQLVKARS